MGRTITLKIKFGDFTQITRNHSLDFYFADEATIFQTAEFLLEKIALNNDRPIRLLGITLSNFPEDGIVTVNERFNLFEGNENMNDDRDF